MSVTDAVRAPGAVSAPAGTESSPRLPLRHRVRSAPGDPAWVRPALFALLVATALLYLWGLGKSGYANSFYSAAVQAGTKSWKAFLFGSSDASNFITVDKTPASLWVMELSSRLFGLSSWSILAPQALEGVATVGVLYLGVRRWFGAPAGLLAGAALATTPVAALMFRYNNPDALLVLLLVIATYATLRAIESGRVGWLVAAGVLVGFGFLTKEVQALVVVPALGAAYLLAAPVNLRRRLAHLGASLGGIGLGAGWWVAIVQLTPAADRPYIGGSTNNSLWDVIFGYNGFGRLTGSETGSVGGGAAGTSGRWGATGILRMFGTDFGAQISWLLPAALLSIVVVLVWRGRAARTDPIRASVVAWGGSLLAGALAFSFGKGIIHPYYSVALAPSIAALVAIGAVSAWRGRSRIDARLALGVGIAATAGWAFFLLRRDPSWYPWLRWCVVIAGLAAAIAAVVPLRQRMARASTALVAVGVVSVLAAPAAYSINTASSAHTGAIPSAGPAGGGGFGGGQFGRLRRQGGALFAGAAGFGGTPPAGFVTGGTPPAGFATGAGSTQGATGFGGAGFGGGAARFGGGRFGGAGGNLIDGSKPSRALTKVLESGGGHYTWLAAVTASETASGYQLATGRAVMAIGGFNGTDPTPSLAAFEGYVRKGEIHWYIAGGRGFGATTSNDASAIATWVSSHYTARTIGGVTLYDLSVLK